MLHLRRHTILRLSAIGCLAVAAAVPTLNGAQAPASQAPAKTGAPIGITAAECTVE